MHVAAIRHGQVQEGPGRRTVVWLAGCSIRCDGCINPHLFERAAWPARPVMDVLWEVLAGCKAGDAGVSVVGGEPFDQPDALEALAAMVHAAWRRVRGVPRLILYSGYHLEDLLARPEASVAVALNAADVLVDGPFVRSLARAGLGYRGSANQRVIDLAATRTAGTVVELPDWDVPSVEVLDDGRVTMSPGLARLLVPALGMERLPARQCGQERSGEEA